MIDQAEDPEHFSPSFWRSCLLLRLLLLGGVLAAAFAIAPPDQERFTDSALPATHCQQVQAWQNMLTLSPEYRIIEMQLHFPSDPARFKTGEGLAAMPVAASVPGMQEVLAVAAYPTPAAIKEHDGVHTVYWGYAGLTRRNLNFSALALVQFQEKSPARSLDSQGPRYSASSLATAAARESWKSEMNSYFAGREQQRCSAISEYVQKHAGTHPPLQQFERVLGALRKDLVISDHTTDQNEHPRGSDDFIDNEYSLACQAAQAEKFALASAHETAVLAAWELGMQAIGATIATPRGGRIVAIYHPDQGWIRFDLIQPDQGKGRATLPIVSTYPGRGHHHLITIGFTSPPAAVLKVFRLTQESFATIFAKASWEVDQDNSAGLLQPAVYTIEEAINAFCR